jgi:hypothetical protein
MRELCRFAFVTVVSLALGLATGTSSFAQEQAEPPDTEQEDVVNPAAVISISSCNPTFIANKPGATYAVAAALTAASGKDCIDITAVGVTVDLAGYTATGVSGGNGVDIKAVGAHVTSSVAGGGITGFSVGVLDTASSARIENLGIANNSTAGVEILGYGAGATPFVDGTVVASNNINGNGLYGVYMRNPTHCMVDRNSQISTSSKFGVWIQNTAATAVAADNVVSYNEPNQIGTARIEVGFTGVPGTCSTKAPSVGDIIANNLLPFDATGNSMFGIALECNTGNSDSVFHNTVGPGAGVVDDLFDGTIAPACDSNTWGLDVFGTHNQACAN